MRRRLLALLADPPRPQWPGMAVYTSRQTIAPTLRRFIDSLGDRFGAG